MSEPINVDGPSAADSPASVPVPSSTDTDSSGSVDSFVRNALVESTQLTKSIRAVLLFHWIHNTTVTSGGEEGYSENDFQKALLQVRE